MRRIVLGFLVALALSVIGHAAQAQYSPASQPLGTIPDVVLINQGSGCPSNVAPCATVTTPSVRIGQPVQLTCSTISAPFQYQECIDTSLNPPELKEYIGSTWWPLMSLSPTSPGPGSLIPATLDVGVSIISNGTPNGILYDNAGVLGNTLTLPTQVQDNITQTGTVTIGTWSSAVTSATITASAINSTPIGASVPSTGAFTLLSSIPGTITINGAAGPANSSLWDNSTLAGSTSLSTTLQLTQGFLQPQNAIRCVSSVDAEPIGGGPVAVNCLSIDMTMNGSWTGSTSVLALNQTINSAGGTHAKANSYLPEMLLSQTTTVNLGGVAGSGNGIGNLYGLGIQQLAGTPAIGNSYYQALSGQEIDYGMQANTFAQSKTGLQLALWNGDIGCANVYSECAALWITSIQSGASVNDAIFIGGVDEQWPISTTGSLLRLAVNTPSTIGNGINLSDPNLQISNCSFENPAFCLKHNSPILAFRENANMGINQYSNDDATDFGVVVEFDGVNSSTVNANHISILAAPTSGIPVISAVGSDTNIPMLLRGKGTGAVSITGLFNLNGVVPAGSASNYVCADSSGNVLLQSGAC